MALARWKDLCLDAVEPTVLGRFWGAILGLDIELLDDGDAVLRGTTPQETIWVNQVPEGKTAKHRVHIDVHARGIGELVDAGATVLLPASESGFPWTILADPEGGEFCAFVRDPWEHDTAARPYELIVNTSDAESSHRIAQWWGDVLGATVHDEPEGYSWIDGVPDMPWASMDFTPVPEPKAVKNRIHWDLTCDDIDALLDHGATVLAEPTEQTRWHVLADPDGNEFCAFPTR